MTTLTIPELESLFVIVNTALRDFERYRNFTADHERVGKDIDEIKIILFKITSCLLERKMQVQKELLSNAPKIKTFTDLHNDLTMVLRKKIKDLESDFFTESDINYFDDFICPKLADAALMYFTGWNMSGVQINKQKEGDKHV